MGSVFSCVFSYVCCIQRKIKHFLDGPPDVRHPSFPDWSLMIVVLLPDSPIVKKEFNVMFLKTAK